MSEKDADQEHPRNRRDAQRADGGPADAGGDDAPEPNERDRTEAPGDDFSAGAGAESRPWTQLGKLRRANAREKDASDLGSESVRQTMRESGFTSVHHHYYGGNHFGDHTTVGDISGGNVGQAHTNTESSVHIRPAEADQLRAIVDVFRRVPSMVTAIARLAERPVLVLMGGAGVGKTTAALRMLVQLHDTTVAEIVVGRNAAQIAAMTPEPTTGYLLRLTARSLASDVGPATLSALSERLAASRSHLVITVEHDVSRQDDWLDEWLQAWTELPDAREVLLSHLQWHEARAAAACRTAAELTAHPDVAAKLSDRTLPGEAARLADALAPVLTGHVDVGAALRTFNDRTESDIAAWLCDSEQGPADDIPLVVALAVLEGASPEVVRRGAADLEAELAPAASPPQRRLDLTPSSVRLARARASIERYDRHTEYGIVPGERVVFDNTSYPRAVLSWAWREANMDRAMVAWLEDLVRADVQDLRIRGALAAGYLCVVSFAHVVDAAIRPWARSSDPHLKVAAAVALGVATTYASVERPALRLLRHWVTQDHVGLRTAALDAYGAQAAFKHPRAALDGLCSAIDDLGDDDSDWDDAEDIYPALQRNLSTVYEVSRERDEMHLTVLDALVDRVEHPAPALAITVILLFLDLTLLRTVISPPEWGRWPTLLALSTEDEHRRRVVALWRASLNDARTRDWALDAFEGWVLEAEDDRRLIDELTLIVGDIVRAGSPREGRRLLSRLRRWATRTSSEHDRVAETIVQRVMQHA